jgi:hypothetical protein
MNPKRKKRGIRPALLIVAAVLVVAYIAWLQVLNRWYDAQYSVPSRSFTVGEQIDFGDNMVEHGYTVEGCSLTCVNWGIYTPAELQKAYDLSITPEEMDVIDPDADLLVVVETDVRNDSADEIDLPVFDFTFYSSVWTAGWNDTVMEAMNDGLDYYLTCPANATRRVYLVYELVAENFPDDLWEQVREAPMSLNLAYYPEELNLVLQ